MKDRMSQFLYNARQRAASFMAGRNGNDGFNLFLLVCELILLLLAALLGSWLYLPALALLVYIYFRMLSRNVYKRQDENGRYLRAKYKIQSRLRLIAERWKQRRDYKFFFCPAYQATLRGCTSRGEITSVCRTSRNTLKGWS